MSPLTVLARSSRWSAPSAGSPAPWRSRADRPGDGGDVGPHGDPGRDPDPDVAGRALDREPAAVGGADHQVAAAGGHGDVGPWPRATSRSPEPVLTAAGPLARPIRTSPDPVDTATAPSVCSISTWPEPLLTRSSPLATLDGDVAGAGLDEAVAGQVGEAHVARAALDLGGADGAVDGDVGAAGLDGQLAGERDGDGDVEPDVAAEEAAALAGRDDADPPAVLSHLDLLGVPAGDLDVGLGGVGGGDLQTALAELDVQLDGACGSRSRTCVLRSWGASRVCSSAGPACGRTRMGAGWWVVCRVRPSRSCGAGRRGPSRTGRCRRRTGCSRGRCRR